MEQNIKKPRMKIYLKFALSILAGSIIPIALLATVITNWMFSEYRTSLEDSYAQGVAYAKYSVENLFSGYNTLSKFSYYYNPSSTLSVWQSYGNSDNLRSILTGEAFPEAETAWEQYNAINDEMSVFLENLLRVDSSIAAVHFIHWEEDGSYTTYHKVSTGSFASEDAFLEIIDLDSIDKSSAVLQVIPLHAFSYAGYQSAENAEVITVARNYFQSTTMLTTQECVGTLLIDFKIDGLETIFTNASFLGEGETYLYQGDLCLYSTDEQAIGTTSNDPDELADLQAEEDQFVFVEYIENHDIYVVCNLDSVPLDDQMKTIQRVMYFFIALSILLLIASSFFFSKRLTLPITRLMKQMAQVETGQFATQIEVMSNDELGDLTARFNQMIAELDNYTNQVYVAKIQQKEAELNALKSQIYPHFLYNTLEVIRMTALSRRDEKVAYMIEALSDQIRYLIGTVGDIVPLSLEVDILRKYVYLINARYDEQVNFVVPSQSEEEVFIPKLILQPLVENAFVHGIKPQNMDGTISLQVKKTEAILELTIMDNGCGMDADTLREVEDRLASDLPGRKSDYQWNSIGVKNVHDRIRYLYGAPYGISMFSTKGLGTAVKVTLPSNIKEEGAL
ncbi:MAG: sensor histidine kinase [Faecalibacterium sp.]